MKKNSSNLKFIILGVVVVAIAGLAYSLYSFYSSGSADEGIVVCNPDNPNECLWQDHIHALVLVSENGEETTLPIEKGDLSSAHTHEERNVIHWHSSLPYDPETKKAINPQPLMIGNSLESIGIDVPVNSRVFVRKEGGDWAKSSDTVDYVWDDRDTIYVVIGEDERSDEEILSYLRLSNIQLPYLGAG